MFEAIVISIDQRIARQQVFHFGCEKEMLPPVGHNIGPSRRVLPCENQARLCPSVL